MPTQKEIIFDSGSLISMAMSSLYDEIISLKKSFGGKFLITKEVREEIIDKPITMKRFALEAMKLKELINKGILELPESIGVSEKEISQSMLELMELANNSFVGDKVPIKLIDLGETSCVALSKFLSEKGIQNILVVDERTLRLLIEDPPLLKKIFQKRLKAKINFIPEKLKTFKGIKVIRSTELVYIAYKKGLIQIKEKNLLDALLYSLKFSGCAITDEEIEEIEKL